MSVVGVGNRSTFMQVIFYGFLTLLAIFMALPLVYMISHAFKPLEELFLFPPRFLVRHPTTKNFEDLLLVTSGDWVPFSRYLFNSLFVSSVAVVGGVILALMAAYPLAKHQFPGKEFLFLVIVSALMFAPQVIQIPRYLIVHKLGLIDTYGALIIPNLAAPMSLFLVKQFLEPFPTQLFEAAKVDGASEFGIWWRIVVPMTKPAWATITIFTFVAVWNDAFSPIVFVRTEAMKTLPVAVQTIAGGPGSVARAGTVAAASFLMTMPTIIVFVLLQRKVLQTMAYSGIKA